MSANTSGDRVFLVVEDDERLREVLASVLRPDGWRPLFATSGTEALAQLTASPEPPEVALVDLGLPDMDGVVLIDGLTARRPDLPVIVLTVCTERKRILQALRHGARGYLFKDDLGRGLEGALNEALAGGAPMSRAVARTLLDEVRGDRATSPPPADQISLTERELRVVEQLARGLSYNQVGAVLDISANTVRSYVRLIYEKLCVCSKTEAVLAAMRLGLIDPRLD